MKTAARSGIRSSLVLAAVLAAGCGGGSSNSASGGGTPPPGPPPPTPMDSCSDLQIIAEGTYAGRSYRVCGPGGTEAAPVPLVINLHGAGIDSELLIQDNGGARLVTLGSTEGFVTVFPNGTCPANRSCTIDRQFYWNDCRADNGSAERSEGDDVGFLASLVTDVLPARGYVIDPNRVYVYGDSDGGFMSLRVATERPDLVAGVGVINASEPVNSQCTDAGSTPVVSALFMHGTGDPVVPFDGGDVGTNRDRGAVTSTPDTVAFWVERAGCDPTPQSSTLLPDVDTTDGPNDTDSRVEQTVYAGCRDGAGVELFTVDGGGHTVPGATPAASPCRNDRGLGCTNRDIQAADVLWSFFDAHPRP